MEQLLTIGYNQHGVKVMVHYFMIGKTRDISVYYIIMRWRYWKCGSLSSYMRMQKF